MDLNTTRTARQSPVIRLRRPRIRTTYRFASDLELRGRSPQEVVASAHSVISGWLQMKWPDPIAFPAMDTHEPTRYEIPGQQLETIGSSDGARWTARLSQPDSRSPRGHREAVAGRTWTTELSLATTEDAARFVVRIQCASLPESAHEPIFLTRPRIVPEMAERVGLHELRPIDGRPWMLQSDSDLNGFYDLVTSTERRMPIILLTAPDRRRHSSGLELAPFILDHRRLAEDLVGYAYVATLPFDLAFAWTDIIGKPWSAFKGAVRTYLPGLDVDSGYLKDHPLAFVDRILKFEYAGLKMEEAFERFLISRVRESTSHVPIHWGPCEPFLKAKGRSADEQVDAAGSDIERVEALSDQVSSLQEQLAQAEGEAEQWSDATQQADENRTQAEQEASSLRNALDAVRAGYGVDNDPARAIARPQAWEDFSDWIEQCHAGKLKLHRRATRSLKSAQFEDIGLCCDAIDILANEYRRAKIGIPDSNIALDARLQELRLEISGSLSRKSAGEFDDEYFVAHPYPDSQKAFLESHVKNGGNSRDPGRCLRIYFFWDGEKQEVIVGWLPSHLRIRVS